MSSPCLFERRFSKDGDKGVYYKGKSETPTKHQDTNIKQDR